MKEQLTGRSGQSLLEIMIGLALIVLGVGSAAVLVFGGQKILIDRGNTISARNLAKEGLDAARAIRERNWSELTDGEHGLVFATSAWAFSGSSDTDGFFTRKIIITTQDENTKKVESEVTWAADPLRTLNVELVTLLTNWENALPPSDPGDTGGSSPSGNWQNPQTLGSVDLGAGNSATDLDVISKIVYLTTSASSKSKPDFHTVDANNPSLPVVLDSLDVDAYALVGLDMGGSHAYTAANGVIPDLKIVSASDPNNLSLTSDFNVITFVNSLSVFRNGGTALLGVQRTGFNGEFFTIDVSNPSSPSQLDVFEVDGDVNDIYVRNNIAYLATSRDDAEIFILDVSNPGDIRQLGFFSVSGTTDAYSVFVLTLDRVFLGVGNVLYILNASNPANVTVLGSLDVGGTINDIYVAGSLAFLATSNSNSEFQAINIADPMTPTLHSSLNFPQVATGIDYENNIVYVSVRSNDALRIITSSP